MKLVYTTGVFDMLHPGHINILKTARSFGDKLLVGIQSDNSSYKQKGRLPILNQEQRKTMLENLSIVNKVIIYDDIDQTKNLKIFKPNILVQGSDWDLNNNRNTIKKFLTKNNIILKIIEYTNGISTSQIRNKVINSFYLNENKNEIIKNIQIMDINDISIYEKNSIIRTENIKKNISNSNILKTPIIITQINGKNILIDGNNRLNSLKSLGIKKVLVYKVDYYDEKIVSLLNNMHYLNINENDFLNKIKEKNIKIERINNIDDYKSLIINNEIDFSLKLKNNIYISYKEPNIEKTIIKLNLLVGIYIKKFNVKRISEIKESENKYNTSIIFKKFTKNEIVDIVNKGLIMESGITWHKFNINLLNINININDLKDDKINIKKYVDNLPIRHFFGNTYIFNN